MGEIERIEQLYKDYVAFCCKLCNQHEGLAEYIYKEPLKKIESKMEQRWKEGNLTGFILALNNMKQMWMVGLNKFTQENLNL